MYLYYIQLLQKPYYTLNTLEFHSDVKYYQELFFTQAGCVFDNLFTVKIRHKTLEGDYFQLVQKLLNNH